jgi:hypothetical protein
MRPRSLSALCHRVLNPPRPSRPRPRLRLTVEELESRLTPSGALVNAPGPLTEQQDVPVVFSANVGTAITVSDPAIGAGQDTVFVQAFAGTLTASNTAALGVISGNGSSLVALTGTLTALNGALSGLSYAPPAGFNSTTGLSVLLVPSSGPDASAFVSLDFASTFPPTIDGPHTQEMPGTGVIAFSPANGNGITVVAPGAGSNIYTMTLDTGTGSLTVLNSAGLTSMVFMQSQYYADDHYLEIMGTVPALNAALNGLEYQSPPGIASDYFAIFVGENGPTGAAEAGADLSMQLTNYGYTDVAPTVTGPGFQAFTTAGATFSQANGNPIHVADADADGRYETAYVQVAGGTLTVANGISLGVSGNGTAHVTITSTVAIINSALDGLHYTPAADHAADYLNVLVGDGARTGSLAVLLGPDDSATLAPIIAVPQPLIDYEGSSLAFSEADGNPIQLSAGDANGATESLVLQMLQGQLAVGNTAGLATISGNGSSSLYMTGTLAALNTALDGLQYTSPDTLGTDFLSIAFGNNGSVGGATRYAFAGVSIELIAPPENSC